MTSWTQIGELAALSTAVLWTLSTLAWTSAGRHLGALPVSFLRLVITCLLLMVYGVLVRGFPLPSDASAERWLILGLAGLMGFFVADVCLFKAFLVIGPRLTLLVQSLMPPMAALVSWLLLGDELSPKQWLAMGITLAGVVWVTLERPNGRGGAVEKAQPSRPLRLGLFLAVFAAVAQAFGTVLSKMGIGDYDAGAATFIRVLGAMLGYLTLLTLLGRWHTIRRALRQPKPMLTVALGSVVGPFLGVMLYLVALRHCPAGIVATIVSTTPVLILPFVVFVYHEKVSLRAVAGAVLSVVGVALFSL